MADVTLKWNEAALTHLLKSPAGEVGADLKKRAQKVVNQAKLNASGRPGPMVRTGRLRSSMTYTIGSESVYIVAIVGTNVYYGKYLEFGTRRMPPYPFLGPAIKAAG